MKTVYRYFTVYSVHILYSTVLYTEHVEFCLTALRLQLVVQGIVVVSLENEDTEKVCASLYSNTVQYL